MKPPHTALGSSRPAFQIRPISALDAEREDMLARLEKLERRLATFEARHFAALTMKGAWVPVLRSIFQAICDRFGIPPAEILSRKRPEEIAWARHLAMYLARRFTTLSSNRIGKQFKRDHGTVLAAIKHVESRCSTDSKARADLAALEAALAESFATRVSSAMATAENAENTNPPGKTQQGVQSPAPGCAHP